jgi:hypothetical protein
MKMKNKLIDIHNELLDLEDQLNQKYCDILDRLNCEIVVEYNQFILEYNDKDWIYFNNKKDLESYLL